MRLAGKTLPESLRAAARSAAQNRETPKISRYPCLDAAQTHAALIAIPACRNFGYPGDTNTEGQPERDRAVAETNRRSRDGNDGS